MSNEKRFITIEQEDGTVTAHSEFDDYLNVLATAACWVWQFAKTAREAISQHPAKHNQWDADMQAGKPEKHTY